MAKLKTSLTVYNWVFKFIGAALLVIFAIILRVVGIEHWVEAFFGLLIGGYAVMRLVPFIKTQRSDLIKTINIFEIGMNIVVAVIFIGNAFVNAESLGSIFSYIFGAVLIIRGMVHFYGISDGNEKGDNPTYFFHIGTLIMGTLIIIEMITTDHFIWLMVFLSVGSGAYLGYSAYGGYSMYRRRKQMEEPKEKSDDKEIVDIPRKEDPVKEQDQIVS